MNVEIENMDVEVHFEGLDNIEVNYICDMCDFKQIQRLTSKSTL